MSSRQKSVKRHESVLTYLIFTMIIGYAAFLLVSTQIEISEKNTEYESIHSQLLELQVSNEQLERYSGEDFRSEYIEEIARNKLGYAHPQEQIFYVIPNG